MNIPIQLNKILGKTGERISSTFLVNFVVVSIGLVTNILIARLFGQENFGVYSYFFGLTNLIYIFAGFGLVNSVAKLTKENLSKNLVKKIILFLVAASFIFSLIAYYVGNVFELNPDINYFFISVFGYSMVICIFMMLSGAIRRLEKYELATYFSLYNRIILISLVIVIGFIGKFWWIFPAMAFAILFLLPFEFKRGSFSKKAQKLIPLLKTSLPFFLSIIGVNAIYHIDRISIKFVFDFISLGYYTGFANYVNILRTGAYVIPFVMITASARKKFDISKSVKKLIILLVPISIGIGFTAPIIVPFLFGSEYSQINYLLIWSMVLSCTLLVIYSLINSLYLSKTHNKIKNYILFLDALLSTAINMGLNILLISRIGLAGAPIATSIVLSAKIALNRYGIKTLS
jgi:O-antigen/teichoic acid export membrane protein